MRESDRGRANEGSAEGSWGLILRESSEDLFLLLEIVLRLVLGIVNAHTSSLRKLSEARQWGSRV